MANKKNLNLKIFSSAAEMLLSYLEPTQDDIDNRAALIKKFKKFTQKKIELEGCIFEPYGSYESRLYTRYGDVDLSVTHTQNNNILRTLYDIMMRSPEFWSIEYRANTRVPVLTFKHKGSDVPFDVTVHDASGKTSALLMSRISDIDPRFRQVVLLVKGWVMRHNIHKASEGGFKSYALYVMVIFLFQRTNPPILPPLTELCTSVVMQKIDGGDEGWKPDFEDNVARFKNSRDWKKNYSDVYRLFYLFIKEFTDIEDNAKQHYMSARIGDWVTNCTPEMNNAQLWIQEPFGKFDNLARSIEDVTHIGNLFRQTNYVIERENLAAIIGELITKEQYEEILSDIREKEEREKERAQRAAIVMPSSTEVGPKAVASRDMISSSAVTIPMSSQVPAKTSGTQLVGYSSDDDEDKEADNPPGVGCYGIELVKYSSDDDDEDKEVDNPLGVGCYGSDNKEGDSHEVGPNGDTDHDLEKFKRDNSKLKQSTRGMDAGKHELTVKGGLNEDSLSYDAQGKSPRNAVDNNDNKMRSSSKEYHGKVETGMDKKHMKAYENSKIQDEKHINREKKTDDQNGSKEKLKGRDSEKIINKNQIKDDKKEMYRDRRSHAEEDGRRLAREDKKKHKTGHSLSPGRHSRQRSREDNSSVSHAHRSCDSRRSHSKRSNRSQSPEMSRRYTSERGTRR